MIQLSQSSEGGFSDIISDVDKFMEENGIKDDVNEFLRDVRPIPPTKRVLGKVLVATEVEEDFKPTIFFVNYPPEQPQNVCTDDYSGPYKFDVFIIPNDQKTPWEFSPKLNKIFIGINVKFPVAFSVQQRPDTPLFIRTTPVFSQQQHFQESVQRCVGHQHPQDPSNADLQPHIFQHIVRCSNEQTHYFGGTKDNPRLNLVVPLNDPQVGTDVVREFFHFVCKNSCPSGMNRRPVDVVFTLETESGEVVGRRVVSVRVCSCPKRDREKEENDVDKRNPVVRSRKRRLQNTSEVRQETIDTRLMPLHLNVPGKQNQQRLLMCCRDLMASEIVRLEGIPGADQPFRKCYNDVNALIDKMAE